MVTHQGGQINISHKYHTNFVCKQIAKSVVFYPEQLVIIACIPVVVEHQEIHNSLPRT